MSQGHFIDVLLPKNFGRNERLIKITDLLDWRRIERLLRVVRNSETGRPPYEALAMFKALLLQQWYGLSDPGLEEALLDRISFRRFCGFEMDQNNSPDETTICRFRNVLKEAGLGEKLFIEINAQLEASGFLLKQGTLIDATLIKTAVTLKSSC